MASNKTLVPEAKAALDQFKMEAASEVGVNLKQGYRWLRRWLRSTRTRSRLPNNLSYAQFIQRKTPVTRRFSLVKNIIIFPEAVEIRGSL